MLVNVTATQEQPAVGISFKGIGFRDASYTYLHPHGMPSGGDWNLQRHAALFTEGTEGLEVDGCKFERLDGNAVAISGYSRNATVSRCHFSWIGDSAIISWGYTSGSPVPGMGPDASDGNHPQYNQIVHNFGREVGIWQKVGHWYQFYVYDDNVKHTMRIPLLRVCVCVCVCVSAAKLVVFPGLVRVLERLS